MSLLLLAVTAPRASVAAAALTVAAASVLVVLAARCASRPDPVDEAYRALPSGVTGTRQGAHRHRRHATELPGVAR